MLVLLGLHCDGNHEKTYKCYQSTISMLFCVIIYIYMCVSPLYLRVPMFPSRGPEPGGGSPANEDAPHLGENVPAFFQFNF